MTDLQTPPADRDLLRAFADRADQAAFAELVRRHGGLVLGVCRRVLADAPDADDAFQAVFLVLARKAGSVRSPEQLGNWLYGVAVRCAKRAKVRTAKRRAREQPMTERPHPGGDPADWRDVRPVLDEEIARLPEKLRAVVVLCELDGVSRSDAAAKLGVPEGTVSSRLARGKESLRRRLVKRGVALTAIGLGVLLSQAAPAAVPPALAMQTVSAAIGFAAGGSAAAGAAGLATTEIKLMFWVKLLKVGLAAVLVSAVGGGAAVGLVRAVPTGEGPSFHDAVRSVHDSARLALHGPAARDKDKLQGEWTVKSARVDGHDPGEKLVLKSVTFDGDKVLLAKGQEGTFKLDPAKDPKHLDLNVTEGPHTGDFPGVYKLDGDKLTFHFAHKPGGDRPGDFECKEGGQTVLLTMERAKK